MQVMMQHATAPDANILTASRSITAMFIAIIMPIH